LVDLALLQSVSYIAGALGVCVAAAYYIINLRINMKAKEMEICRYITDRMTSDTGMQTYGILMQKNVEWKDHNDFMKKYGYDNVEFFGHWTSWFLLADTLGYIVKNKIARVETIYDLGGWGFIRVWEKYKGFILSRREVAYGSDFYASFEYFAGEMLRIKKGRDASFGARLEQFRETGGP